MQQLRDFDGEIVLFGGEPTLYPDRLNTIYMDPVIRKKIRSITTNLVDMNPLTMSILKDIKYVGTSWNPHRFTEEEYISWQHNLSWLAESGMNVLVLITLTGDLFEMDKEEFLDMTATWDPKEIAAIRFEYLVADGLTQEYYDAADEWQAYIYSHWKSKVPMDVENIRHWYFDCSEVYTLHPNGVLEKGCPNHKRIEVPIECYSCDRADVCRPCILHNYCSFPKKLAALIEKGDKENEGL